MDKQMTKQSVLKKAVLGVALALGAMAGSITAAHATAHTDEVRAHATDVYHVVFRRGQQAHVGISGDGDTDLDLFIYDENSNLICSRTGPTDDEDCYFNPRWTGPFTIKVRNLGGVYNEYMLLTN